jgi:hypothetical protein
MATRWLVKTKSDVCCCLASSCAPTGRVAGGRRFLGFRPAVARPWPDCTPGYNPVAPSALKNTYLHELVQKKGQPTGEPVPNAP